MLEFFYLKDGDKYRVWTKDMENLNQFEVISAQDFRILQKLNSIIKLINKEN